MNITFVYGNVESLGIEVLSSIAKKKGHKTQLVFDHFLNDNRMIGLNYKGNPDKYYEVFAEKIIATSPDLIAFSAVTYTYQWALKVIKHVRKISVKPIILGGVHPTLVPDKVMDNVEIDMICVGEGDIMFPSLLDNFEKIMDGQKLNIPNLWYRGRNGIIKNEPGPLVHDLDSLPLGDKGLFLDKAPYLKDPYYIMTGRGCPYKCTYCGNDFFYNLYRGKGQFLRRRSVDNVIEELSWAKKQWNFRELWILDDVFAIDVRWLEEFSVKYKKQINVPYSCFGHPKALNEKIVRLLKESKCKSVEVGVQTINEEIRKKYLNRMETNADIEKAFALLKKYKVPLVIDHMAGLPDESDKDYLDAAAFYSGYSPKRILFNYLNYYPGTEIMRYAEEKGFLNADELEEIKEGKTASNTVDGNVKNPQKIYKFEFLFSMIPVFPKWVIRFVVKYGLYDRALVGSRFIRSSMFNLVKLVVDFNFRPLFDGIFRSKWIRKNVRL
jgi:radical SAM superfamily enzyme YgiQ (UPF0313 family)